MKKDKADYIGRDAISAKQDQGLQMRLLQFKLTDPEPLLYHAEPVFRNGEFAGYLTSGSYGHHIGAAMGMGYVQCPGEKLADVLACDFEIEVAGKRVKAEASSKPFYDPTSERVKV